MLAFEKKNTYSNFLPSLHQLEHGNNAPCFVVFVPQTVKSEILGIGANKTSTNLYQKRNIIRKKEWVSLNQIIWQLAIFSCLYEELLC